jgi:hypothetical protein
MLNGLMLLVGHYAECHVLIVILCEVMLSVVAHQWPVLQNYYDRHNDDCK